jgi:FkbM family methyltransferase
MDYQLDSFVSTCLDVGANAGHFANDFRKRYRAEVVCLEPSPVHIANLRELGFETHNVGASNFTGIKKFYLNSSNPGSTGNSFYLEQTVHYENNTTEAEIQVVKLDDFFQGRTFDFIKVDTQGSEYDIVEGAKNLISKCKFLLIEVPFFSFNTGAKLAHEVIPLISSLGLVPYSFPEFHKAVPKHFPGYFTDKFNDMFITHMDILWKNPK